MAVIRFYEELNDFLKKEQKKTGIHIKIFPHQTVKDLIESMNVPHTEVDLILVNGEPVDFRYQAGEDDRISVYPVFESFNINGLSKLREKPLRVNKFVLDVHLGKLARYMRFSGLDTLYSNKYEDREIAEISDREGRAVLTRDRGLLKRSIIKRGYWIRSCVPAEQFREVIKRFDLEESKNNFTRCPVCNGILEKTEKEDIINRLPEKTARFYDTFKMCCDCGKIYWQGNHYHNFLGRIS